MNHSTNVNARYNLLIVEDASVDSAYIVEALENIAKINVQHSYPNNVHEFEAVLTERQWDVILCSAQLPTLIYGEVLRLTQLLQPPIPIIMLAETFSGTQAVDLMRLGVRGIVEKADTLRLVEFVRQELERDPALNRASEIQTALRVSEARYRKLLAAAPVAIIHSDRDGNIMLANDMAQLLFGYSDDELRGKSIEMLVPQRSRAVHQKLRETYNQAPVRRAMSARSGLEALRKDGSQFPVEIELGYLVNNDQYTVMSFIADITEKQRAKVALQEAHDLLEQRVIERTAELEKVKDRLEAIFDHSGNGILLLNLRDGIQQANHAFETLFDVTPDDYLGIGLTAFVRPEDASNIEEIIQNVVATHQTHQVEAVVRRADGTQFDIEINLAPISRSANPVTNLVCIIRDVSERKKADYALRESENMLQTVIENIPIRIFWKDRYSVYRGCNSLHAKTVGLTTPAEIIGKTDFDFSPDRAPDREADDRKVMESGQSQLNVEELSLNADGSSTWLLSNKVSLRDSHGNPIGVLVTIEDITTRKQAEQMLKDSLIQEKELNELKTRFVSMASHEFRTPLATIMATADTLANYRDRLDQPQIDARLAKIRQQVMHLKDIVDDMLQLSRIQAGRVEFKPTLSNLAELCQELVEEFESQRVHESRIVYTCEDPAIFFEFDERLMRQIINNLIGNALKYSPRETFVNVSLAQANSQIILKVKDQGIGIPANDLKRLFEPFHRGANVTTISGTGLGLSITKQAVALHHGTIEVESQEGAGTTFTIILPKLPSADTNHH